MNRLALFQEIQSDLNLVEKELAQNVIGEDPLLTETSAHLLEAGGKRIRPAFALLAGKFHNYSLPRLMPLAMALELFHMATLVHDDVIDASMLRRGRMTVKARWGDQLSIYTGDYLVAKALSLVSVYQDQRITRVLADVSLEMCKGELEQIATAFDPAQTSKDYFWRIKRKTALLIAASLQLGSMAVHAPAELVSRLKAFGHNIGMAFQITDDILDFTADEKVLGKPVGSDLRQGILTLPAVYALRHSPAAERLRFLIASKQIAGRGADEGISIVLGSGGIQSSQALADRYLARAKRHLALLPDVPTKQTLAFAAGFVGQRKF